MTDQMNIPAYPDDHDTFKKMAADAKKSMKELFHDWVERMKTKVKQK